MEGPGNCGSRRRSYRLRLRYTRLHKIAKCDVSIRKACCYLIRQRNESLRSGAEPRPQGGAANTSNSVVF